MNLRIIGTARGITSAAFLTCLVIASVLLTQPEEKVDGAGPEDIGQQQISILPRNYDFRSNISSRADKSELPVQSGLSEQSTQSTQSTQSIQSTQSTQSQSDKSTPTKPTSDFTYTIKSGDTLSELAATYGVTVKNIMAANGLASDKLSLDQKLLIPASGKVKVIPPAPKTAAKSTKPAPTASKAAISRAKVDGRIVGDLVKWSEARNIFGIGAVASITDVNTGYTFKIKRKGGHNHADCEPLTSADTAIMKKVYGSWSWSRRAIVVEINGRKIAASMAGMPHASDDISGNGFAGHFDVHFLGSMTHGSEYTKSRVPQVDPDHQAMVRKAAGV